MCRSTNQRSARLVARIGPKRPLRLQNHCAWLQMPVADKKARGPANGAGRPTLGGHGAGVAVGTRSHLAWAPLPTILRPTAWRSAAAGGRSGPLGWAALAQLVRALDCGSRGPPFEPGRRYQFGFLRMRAPPRGTTRPREAGRLTGALQTGQYRQWVCTRGPARAGPADGFMGPSLGGPRGRSGAATCGPVRCKRSAQDCRVRS
jgi:hypothetical protein